MNHCVGIDLTATAIRLVQLSRKRGRLSVLGTHVKPLGSDGLPQDADAVRALLSDTLREAGFKTFGSVVAALPYPTVHFHGFRTEVAAQDDIRRLLRFELEDDLPIPFDDLVADVCGWCDANEGERRHIVAAAARRDLVPWCRALEACGWKGSVLSTDVCALEILARRVRPEAVQAGCLVVHVDGSRMVMAALRDGGLACARHRDCAGDAEAIAAALSRDIELTLRTAFRNGASPQAQVLLSGPDALCRELLGKLSDATGRDVHPLQADSMLQEPQAGDFDGGSDIALGLALLGLEPAEGRLDFLTADVSHKNRVARSRTKRAVSVSGVLLAAILGLLAVRTVREVRGLEAEHARLSREIRTVFVTALPGEKRIVNELAQMTEHLNAQRKRRDTLAAAVGQPIRPLWALQVLSEASAPDQGVRVSSFEVKGKTIHVGGTGESFESIESLLARLRKVPEFLSVELEDVASNRGRDRPEFRILISVKAG